MEREIGSVLQDRDEKGKKQGLNSSERLVVTANAVPLSPFL
jgi:hypothetical protein